MTQLKTQLKTLKLSGMLEQLELRLLEAQQSQLSYSEFLSMLMTNEMEKRNTRKVARLIQLANMGCEKTLENFDFSFNHSINAPHIRELATCRFVEQGQGIFLLGPTGTGKTHLAKAICHQACRRYLTVTFFSFYQFFNELHKAEQKKQLQKYLNQLVKVDLLAIDDFGFKKINQQEAEYLYAIVDARCAVKSMILTSNRAMSDWLSIFPDPVIANAILDRLAHHSHQIVFKGESYRKKFSPKFENP
jgi:DNA replication protein DnaC